MVCRQLEPAASTGARRSSRAPDACQGREGISVLLSGRAWRCGKQKKLSVGPKLLLKTSTDNYYGGVTLVEYQRN
jgi:hypothetical protein